ncbi:MAG TPA: toxin [Candidatus Paceibacterota bacterium]|nr:toxin [Candidatus Paceibacterota bacterium]HMP19224.1 toxin [Candidatus Paceibacterota bacterium]HMP85516.1 toxin [Candidatus Paceibacterota bacterium]
MTVYDWYDKKNQKLKKERNISFEEVIVAIESKKLLDIVKNKRRHKNQKIFIVEIDNYAYCVPFEDKKEKVILKTIFLSEKATKKYLL